MVERLRQIAKESRLLPAISAITIGGILAQAFLISSDIRLFFLGLVGFFVIIAIVFKPKWGLFVLVFVTYIQLSTVLVVAHDAPSIAKVLVPTLLGVAILHRLSARKTTVFQSWELPTILLFLYGVVILASLLYTNDFEITKRGLLIYVKDALLAVTVILLLNRGAALRGVVWSLLTAGIFLGTISVVQYLTGSFWKTYGGFAMNDTAHIVSDTHGYRIAGPMLEPNSYAQLLVVLVPLALDRLWHCKLTTQRLVAGWALTVCVLSIVFTFSRLGFLAMIIVVGLKFINHRPSPLIILATMLVLIFSWPLVPVEYKARIATLGDVFSGKLEDESFRGRLSEVTSACMIFVKSPLLGVGYDTFGVNYQKYAQKLGLDPRLEERGAHCLYLEIAAETGLFGLIVFGVILISIFSGIQKSKRLLAEANLAEYWGMINAFGIGLIGYLICSIFLHLTYPRFFWLLVGIALAIPQVATYEIRALAKMNSQVENLFLQEP